MRKLFYVGILFVLGSCELFQSKEERTADRVQEQLLDINWNDVDAYPLFEDCDESAIKKVQRDCFITHMTDYFSTVFVDAKFEVEEDVNETLFVDFKIDEHGFISVLEIGENERINALLPNFNEEVSKRFNDLTTVAPAIKQGTPVSMKFRLPLLLNTQN